MPSHALYDGRVQDWGHLAELGCLSLSSLRTWKGAVPQMWWVVLFRSGPHSIMSEAFECLYLQDPQLGATGTLAKDLALCLSQVFVLGSRPWCVLGLQ